QLQATIELNFGITTDRFLVVSGAGFARFINAIGGIPIYLPYPIQDKNTRANFKAGHQWFTGAEALKLARIRMDSNDFVRIQRQSWLLQGVLQSLARPETLSRLPQILEALHALYITDLTPDDITRFTCLLGLMLNQQREPIFFEVPQELLSQTRAPVYNVLTLAPKGKKATPSRAFVLEWDDAYKTWLQQALRGEIQP
ncbi:LytR family transcriptional regulator, partial [Candidatus Parcubacteria bacterium]